MKKRWMYILSFVVIFSMFLAACQPAAVEEPVVEEPVVEEPVVEEPVVEEPVVEEPVVEEPAGDKVRIRWFVGLGAGSDEGTFEPQQAVVDEINAITG
jgi:hypothetical protein